MHYADLSFKKISLITAVILILSLLVSTTAITWGRTIGTFSIPGVEFQVTNNTAAWWYRFQFNSQFARGVSGDARSLLALLGLTTLPASDTQPTMANAQAIPVLLYHGILSTSDGSNVNLENFKQQMFALKDAGWHTVTIEDFVSAMQGKTTLPPKSFLLTFDDARKDSYYPADPILQALGFNAVMYVITGHSLTPGNEKSHYYLSENELKQMVASGRWELESHSRIGHAQYPVSADKKVGDFFGNKLWIPSQNAGESADDYKARVNNDLTTYFDTGAPYSLSPGRLETADEYKTRVNTDLTDAKQDLVKEFGKDILSFAYPYNDFAQDLKNDSGTGTALVDFVNQTYAVSFYQWYYSLGSSENYPGMDGQLLKRVEPKPDWTATDLMAVLAGGQPKPMPYASTFSTNDGWLKAWGNVQQNDGALALSAATSTAGAMTLLDGSRAWTNYGYTLNLDWTSGQSVSLIGHYQADPQKISYVACNFGNGSVRIEEHLTATTTIVTDTRDQTIGLGRNKNAGMVLSGANVQCLWDGKIVAIGHVSSQAPQNGGVGVEVWGEKLNNANLLIHDASVKYASI